MNFLRFFLSVSLIVLSINTVHADVIKSIKFTGNKQIGSDTLLSKIQFKPGKDYNNEDLNFLQKKLFSTGYFADIKFKIQDEVLFVTVKENPIIDFFYIYGDENKDRVDKIYEIIELKSGNLFSDYKLLNDISKISEIYKFAGFYDVKVEPTVKLVEKNKVNISIKITKNNKYKINRIYFIGDKVFSPAELSDVVSSSEDGWWKFLSATTLLNEERIKLDKYYLKKFYLDEGYYDVQILSSKIDILKNNRADILFSIQSGPRYSFGNVIFEKLDYFNQEHKNFIFSQSKKIIQKGYSKKKVNELKNKISDFLITYKFQNLDFKILEIKNDNKINLKVIFNEKKLSIIKNILVKGNSITEEKVIRNELFFSEGDSLTNYKISKSEDNLNSLGIFRNVKIKENYLDANLVDIEISVEEQPTGSIMGGVGIGSNETAISFSISERNFLGSNIYINSSMSIGTEKISGNFVVANPDYNDTGRMIKNNFFIQETNYESVGYDSSMVGDDISTSYNLYEDVSFTLGLGFDYDKISTTSTASSIYKNQAGNYATLKTFYGVTNDKRNRKFNTTSGHYLNFNQTIAVPGSDIHYIRNNLSGKYYYPFSNDYIVNLRSGLTTINAYGDKDVKLSNRLFLSGSQLRGFEPRAIGPVENNDHVGGNYSMYAGISSTFPNPLPERWNAKTIAFLDAGNVWGVDYDNSKDSSSVRSSIGLALDWTSPLGPISFTLSETINKSSTDKDQKFSFQIGSTF